MHQINEFCCDFFRAFVMNKMKIFRKSFELNASSVVGLFYESFQ
jgi:hypothetical protein